MVCHVTPGCLVCANGVVRVGDQSHVMSYSMTGGQFYNLVITIPEPNEPSEWDPEGSCSIEKMQSYFIGWDPA